MMVTLKRTTSQDSDFNYLVTLLNKDFDNFVNLIVKQFTV